MHVVKNDLVRITAGNEVGKQGKVLRTFPKSGKVLVEGVRLIKRHSRPSQQNPKGGIVEKEAPIYASNVQVVCPKCGKPTRVKHRILETGKSTRVCMHCSEMLSVQG
ncbi:50S ribosomal protein L24 [candidate division KSB1 bacterium]